MKSTELHPATIRLGAVRWGSFDLILDGVNTRGAWTRCTVRIEWALWPMIAAVAKMAWKHEKQKRANEMMAIEETLPCDAVGVLSAAGKCEEDRRAA